MKVSRKKKHRHSADDDKLIDEMVFSGSEEDPNPNQPSFLSPKHISEANIESESSTLKFPSQNSVGHVSNGFSEGPSHGQELSQKKLGSKLNSAEP